MPDRLMRPSTWPVRWRLALASAALTLAILLVFGGIVGRLAGNQIRDDFDRELRGAVRTLSDKLAIVPDPGTGELELSANSPNLADYTLPNDAEARIYDPEGNLVASSRRDAPLLGDPTEGGIHDFGSLRVATAPVELRSTGELAGVVQYAQSRSSVDATVERLWIFIGAGILGGTLLATLAGLAIAQRAMRPIASLTATARKIAATGDPSLHVPQPAASDEVAELATTLEDMLRALDSAQSQRQTALDRQREFVADASHELRTPLTSVLANLELLQASLEDGGAPSGEDSEIVSSALRSSRRMSRLVSDLLILARADAGRSGEHAHCDLAGIARSAAEEVLPMAGRRSFEVYDGPSVQVAGNPDELHRLILNLLENAVRHTPGDSHVILDLRVSSDGGVILEVADDGPGIPGELRDQVFDRFVRGFGPADTSERPGTGLGLAIVRAVAESHGGSVSALESDSGGALFRVRVPAADSQEALKEPLETL